MLVNGNDFYCGNSSGSLCQFALTSQIPSAYVHPSTKQCNYSVDLSGYAKSSDVESLKSSVSSGKSLVASAVTGKGVSTAADASFQTIANNISSISTESTYGTLRVYDAWDTSTYYPGRVIYLSGFREDFSIASNYNIYGGPGLLLAVDHDADTAKALYRNSSGRIIASGTVGNFPNLRGGPFTDRTFYTYYSSYYREYSVNDSGVYSTGNRSSTETDLSNGKTAYSAGTLGFAATSSYGGSSKIDKSFSFKSGSYGSDSLPILVGDASSEWRNYNSCSLSGIIVHEYNGFPSFVVIGGCTCPSLFQYDTRGNLVPIATPYVSYPGMMHSVGGTWTRCLIEIIYKAKILENNGSSILLQNLGPA